MTTALLPINTSTYFSDLFRLAKGLRDEKSYVPVILFVADYPTRPADIQACEREGLACRVELTREASALPERGRGIGARVMRRLLPEPEASELKKSLRHQRERIAYAGSVLEAESAGVLILAGNLVHYDAPAFVHAAQRRGIPAIVAPSWMAGPLEAAEALHHLPASSTAYRFNGAFAKLRPRWSFQHKGRTLLRLPIADALAMEWLGLAPPKPWVLHSGYQDATAVESIAMQDYCVAEALPSDQLRVTGSAAHDVLSRVRDRAVDATAELRRELSMSGDRPILLSAVPPDMLYTGGRTECEFREYSALLDVWVKALASVPGYDVVLSLHPSQKASEWKHLEAHGARISTARIETLIPLCDLFVASISSTIQWAIACGKPVLNYDVYLYRYKDYVSATGVLLAETKADFLRLLEKLTSDIAFRNEIVARQRASAPHWGVLDGGAVKRLVTLIDEKRQRRSRRA